MKNNYMDGFSRFLLSVCLSIIATIIINLIAMHFKRDALHPFKKI